MQHYIITKNSDDIALQIGRLVTTEDKEANFLSEQELSKQYALASSENSIVLWIDMRGSDLDGLRTMRDTKKLYPFCKFIWVDDDDKQALDAYDEGVDGFLLIPLEIDKIALTLKNLRSN
jgi:DNA-binding NarL/FixJ family response regulator